MKKLFLLLLICFISNKLIAQNLEVKYQEILKIDDANFNKSIKIESSSNLSSDIKDQIAKSIREPKDFTLKIKGHESTYSEDIKIDNNQNSGMRISISLSSAGNNLYKNLSDEYYLKDANVLDKKHTIKDKLNDFKWQLTRESKTILGLEVKKAISTVDSTKTIIAWYAPEIKIKNGPAEYGGLPGLILEVEQTLSNNKMFGSQIYKAVDIQEIPNMKSLEIPQSKKTISEKEYKTLMEKQTEKYKSMIGQGVDIKL